MARIIVITSGKGGVGKTTTTSNLGMSLARLGYKTLLVDADIGLRNLDLLLGLEGRIIYTGVDVIEERCRLEQALIPDKRQPNLTFFPLSSNQSKTQITAIKVKNLITEVQNSYDFIFIDCPAGIDEGFQNAIEAANEAFVVVTPEVPSIRDADKVIGLLIAQNIKKINIIVNRLRPQMVKTDNMMSMEDVRSILGVPVIGIIPDSEQVIIASNRGEPIVLEEKLSLPAQAYTNTARRILGESIDFLELEGKNPVRRFMERLRKK